MDHASQYDVTGSARERRARPRRASADIGRPWSREPSRLPPPKVREAADSALSRHLWHGPTCRRCRLTWHEDWLLDDRRRAVMVLVWRMPGGKVVRIRPFPWFKDMTPVVPPEETVADRFPGVEVGGEPPCPGSPEAWITLGTRRPDVAD